MNSVTSFVNSDQPEFKPGFYRLSLKYDKELFDKICTDHPSVKIHDQILNQIKELIKVRNPSVNFSSAELEVKIRKLVTETNIDQYGVWVYYPWLNAMVHILDKDEFIEVRTNRNKYKITPEEQQQLSSKKIGIIGLSVGQSVALTLAMERTCGEIRLADFDTLDLSNLNRIRSGIQNLGLPKVIVAAREIAEIDPFINVVCFREGIDGKNIDAFINSGGKLDLLIDECDSLPVKIKCREKARAGKIPVLMDTSDRGMLDIERFDLEPDREILHGLVGNFDLENLNDLNKETKLELFMALASFENVSAAMKYSMTEIGKTISTWPQLASSVVLGGAVTTDLARRILLRKHHLSGRFYVDLEELI